MEMSFGLYNAVITKIVFIPKQQSFIPVHNEILFSTSFFDINLLNLNLIQTTIRHNSKCKDLVNKWL